MSTTDLLSSDHNFVLIIKNEEKYYKIADKKNVGRTLGTVPFGCK